MLDSVLHARDRFLKPDGVMFPSRATMRVALVSQKGSRDHVVREFEHTVASFSDFRDKTLDLYDIDLAAIEDAYASEQRGYYLKTSTWDLLDERHVVTDDAVVKLLDLKTCSREEALGVDPVAFELEALESLKGPTQATALVGWFDVEFDDGTQDGPVVVLGTGPADLPTHWGHQVFYLNEAFRVQAGDTVAGALDMHRSEANQRLYRVGVELSLGDERWPRSVYAMP